MDLRVALRTLAGAAAAALALVLATPAASGAQVSGGETTGAQGSGEEEATGARVSGEEATEIARTDPNVIEAAREHRDLTPSPHRSDSNRDWEVGFFSGDEQVVQVVVDDESGEIEESWTGSQVAWRMARGYPGAFGRALNAPYVWIPLCLLFVLGLLDWRRPWRIAHLDLVVIVAGFGLSHYFFNRGEIGLSVPLAYPPLLYLLGRMLWVAARGGEGLRPSVPWTALAVALVFVVGLRVGLNVWDSNVIDVGYSGVIGADKITDGEPLYGEFPADNSHGDTYGPVAYYAYTPFEQVLPWSGRWDKLPAAHAAAIFFDLATIGALLLLGRALRGGRDGTRLGVLLAFAWAACPYTAFALESNSNDSLVSLLLVGTMLVASSPPARGALLGLAAMTKFAPLALAPLFATYRDGAATRSLRTVAPFAAAFALAVIGVSVQTLVDPGLSTFWERTIANQADRDSPFSIWGQEPSLDWLHTAVTLWAAGLALLVAFVPERRDLPTLAALGAAVLIAVQLTIEHWFYLYIPWFLPFIFIALLARSRAPGSA